MSDFRTVLIEDSRIADITSTEVFGVQSSASQSTYQQFQAVSASNSSISFNIQVPSENIVIDRHLLLTTQLSFQLNIPNTAVGGVYPIAVGEPAFQYGLTDSLQAFPLNSLFTTIQTTINNVSVSTNLQDVLPMLMRMSDKRVMSRYNSMTPSLPDSAWGKYSDGVGTNSNPLAAYNNSSYDECFEPRGAYKLDDIIVCRYNGAGVFQDNTNVVLVAGDQFKVFISVRLTEPFLALSPFINCEPEMSAGLVGVNNMSFVFNVDNACRRLFSSSNSFIQTPIVLGWAISPEILVPGPGPNIFPGARPNCFAETKLLFNFLSLQPEQYAKISTKNVVPYLDYPRYLTTSNNSVNILSKSTGTITSQSIQLNQIPDLILICARIPMAEQTYKNPSGFLAIRNIRVNFNNSSGLLASATVQDLYGLSFRNGSSQSYYEFLGEAEVNDNATGGAKTVATTGSLLVLNPVYDFSLPSYLSASSLGQYQFQFNLEVYNQLDVALNPEICIVTVNSGIFATQQGTSQIFTGILTKEQVLRTKEQNPVPHLDSGEYKRMVGGKLMNRGMGNVVKMLKSRVEAMKSGAGSSGGAMSGGSISTGCKSKSKLAKHFA